MMLVEVTYLLVSIMMSIFMLLTVIFCEMNFASHCMVAWTIGAMAYTMFTMKPRYVLSGNVYVVLFSAPIIIGLIGTLGSIINDSLRAMTIAFGVASYIIGLWSWYIISVFHEEHQRDNMVRIVIENTRITVNTKTIGEIAWVVFGPLALLVSSKVEPPTRRNGRKTS